jgi:hypothetical protein
MAKLRRIKPGSVQKTFSNVWYTELWRPQFAMAPQLDWSLQIPNAIFGVPKLPKLTNEADLIRGSGITG